MSKKKYLTIVLDASDMCTNEITAATSHKNLAVASWSHLIDERDELRQALARGRVTITTISNALSAAERRASELGMRAQTAENELRRLKTPPDKEEELRNYKDWFLNYKGSPNFFDVWIGRAERGNA